MAASVAGRTTLAVNAQDELRCWASRAVHVTLFVPRGRLVPLVGVQAVVTGASPPATVGGGKLTGTAPPLGEMVVWFGGQEMVGGIRGQRGRA